MPYVVVAREEKDGMVTQRLAQQDSWSNGPDSRSDWVIMLCYRIAGSAPEQYEVIPVFRLATRSSKIDIYRPLLIQVTV